MEDYSSITLNPEVMYLKPFIRKSGIVDGLSVIYELYTGDNNKRVMILSFSREVSTFVVVFYNLL